MAKESNNALLFAVVFSAFALLIAIQPAAVVDASGCSLTLNRNRVSVTVNSGPCSVRDFPGWCNAYVPSVVVQGQTVRCQYVVIVATPQPTRAPLPVATPTPRPLLERLRIPGFR